MQKLDPKSDGASADIVSENIRQLKRIFPEAFSEDKIDFEALRQALGDAVEKEDERYSFTWHGKAGARRIAQTPSTGTLRPCPAESVNWDSTQNLFIEGDNLEVLKLLQKSYHKKIKMIYIDPPYNTGKEFIYPDNFKDNLDTYLRYTGQKDEAGLKMSANTESSGRYHTNWLNMMYPRLKLARNLLRDDGVIFISIDEIEYAKLRQLCDEIYGEENHIADFVWHNKSGGGNDAKHVAVEHEYVILYAKDKVSLSELFVPYNPSYLERYKEEDALGKYFWDTFKRKSGKQYYAIPCPDGSKLELDELGNPISWLRSEKRFYQDIDNGEIRIIKISNRWSVQFKQRLPQGKKPRTIFLEDSIWDDQGNTSDGSAETLSLFEMNAFQNPKPVDLIKHILTFDTNHSDVILDFFAGSGTSGHAVMSQNAVDNGSRRFILVQLPETIDANNNSQKVAFDFCDKLGKPRTISELTKERLRRSIKKIKEANPLFVGDLGFRVFKLDSSNIKAWDPDYERLEDALLAAVENFKPERGESDVLYELLLKFGLELAAPVEVRDVAGKAVYIIGAGALVVCLGEKLGLETVEGIARLKAELKPEVMRVVFRDAGFADDVVKTNAVQILKQHGITDVRSL